MRHSPFDLYNSAGYADWRWRKLASHSIDPADFIVNLKHLGSPTPAERQRLLDRVAQRNFVIYRSPALESSHAALRLFGQAMGLKRLDNNLCADEDAITTLRVKDMGRAGGYIPYSNKALSWHTDGYYNDSAHQIRGWIIHCEQNALDGGANQLLDPEMAYLLLRDESPALAAAMMHPDAMAIPPNEEGGEEIRGWSRGPVFSVDPGTGTLHMRYSARKRNIVWRDDSATQEAAAFLRELMSRDSEWVVQHRLTPGEGVLSNNVLHNRSAFIDSDQPDQQRVLYRARYYDRIAGTEYCDLNPET